MAAIEPSEDAALDLRATLTRRLDVLEQALGRMASEPDAIEQAALLLLQTLQQGNKILTAGNGGSAAEAQHFAAELVGRFKKERTPYSVISLATDSSVLTALANDYGYDQVFSRQVEALGKPGDVLVAISTSGASENVVRAAHSARRNGLGTVGITGTAESTLALQVDIAIKVPATDTDFVQELHMMVTHVLCDVIETALVASTRDNS